MEHHSQKPRILLVDNYDSFTFNLQHSLLLAGAAVQVISNDAPHLLSIARHADGLVISPGPSHPQNAGQSPQVVQNFYRQKPILGVCLGMQIINEVLGGKTTTLAQPVHGKTSKITVTQPSKIFNGLGKTFVAARYHSLVCSHLPPQLTVTAQYKKIPMAFEHQRFNVFGLQFHPESFLTPKGQLIINNFVRIVHEQLTHFTNA